MSGFVSAGNTRIHGYRTQKECLIQTETQLQRFVYLRHSRCIEASNDRLNPSFYRDNTYLVETYRRILLESRFRRFDKHPERIDFVSSCGRCDGGFRLIELKLLGFVRVETDAVFVTVVG